MFGSRLSREQFRSPETRSDELKNRERGILERIGVRGKDWLKVVGLALLSTVLVEGAFSSEARADDLSVQKTVNLLAKKSDQPTPFELTRLTDQLTSLDTIEPNTPEDKAAALTSKPKRLSTPGVGLARTVTDGVDLRASVDPNGGYALVTFNGDFL